MSSASLSETALVGAGRIRHSPADDLEPPPERPAGRPFLTAAWRELAMLNYEVDPADLQSYLPAGTQLDLYEGRAWLSIVGFRFLDARVLAIALPGYQHFEEVNLRFYVLRRVGERWRRGVVFIRELVRKRLVSAVARWSYQENYLTVPMSHRVVWSQSADDASPSACQQIAPREVCYEWRYRGGPYRLLVEADGDYEPLQPGAFDQFIVEHYWGYTAQRDGGTKEYCVRHPDWQTCPAATARLEGDLGALYGPRLGEALSARPRSAFLVNGSAVEMYPGVRLDGAL